MSSASHFNFILSNKEISKTVDQPFTFMIPQNFGKLIKKVHIYHYNGTVIYGFKFFDEFNKLVFDIADVRNTLHFREIVLK